MPITLPLIIPVSLFFSQRFLFFLFNQIEVCFGNEISICLEIVIFVFVFSLQSHSNNISILKEPRVFSDIYIASFHKVLLFPFFSWPFFNLLVRVHMAPFKLVRNKFAYFNVFSIFNRVNLTNAIFQKLNCWKFVWFIPYKLVLNFLVISSWINISFSEQ